ncbi:hypothetical protein AVEN_11040-1 [Araneus ventricosus]|uniref:Uncharacterized protein n=1 Tax=Araneus ventricosus TaxID=182803 RepID=A0A4Y2LG09_ARAVE|nr:hypothetical protein AVEN_11040-1 [Araneus ventricosus]
MEGLTSKARLKMYLQLRPVVAALHQRALTSSNSTDSAVVPTGVSSKPLSSFMVKRIHPLRYRPRSFSAISIDSGFIIQISAHAGKRETLSTTQLLVIVRHLFILLSQVQKIPLLWWKNLLLNKLSRIKIAKLISFLTDNENLIKQQPDSTTSSDSDPDLFPSSRTQTDGP